MKRFSLWAALGLIAVAGLALAQDTTKLSWTPVAGKTQKYNMVVKSQMDMGGGPQEMTMDATLVNKTVEVKANGNIVVEEIFNINKLMFGAMDVTEMAGGMSGAKSTRELSKTGEVISKKNSSQEMDMPRMENAYQFRFPEAPVKSGESWTIKSKGSKEKGTFDSEATFTFVGTEEVGGKKLNKITIAYKEIDAPTPVSAAGTYWLDPADGEMVQASIKLKNVQFAAELPAVDADVSIKRMN